MAITRIGTYSQIKGASYSLPCIVATTGAITLSGTQTIDGVALNVGDRVLVKDQGTAANGIYVVASGAWSRAVDMSLDDDVFQGLQVFITSGSTYVGSIFTIGNANPITLGTTILTFQLAPYSAGTSGTSGTNGSNGTSGATFGTAGTSGNPGTAGTAGTSGSSGATYGTSGSAGTSGETFGTSGTNGASGTSGTTGTSGVNGTGGTSGATFGTSGTSASSGTAGTSGSSGQTYGTAGTTGTSGATFGTSGTNGRNGTGGTSGTNGANGTSGTSGTTGTTGTSGTGILLPGTSGSAITFPLTTVSTVGQLALGGVVAYIFVPGNPGYVAGETHGLIATVNDLSQGIAWGCQGTSTGATATAIGTGQSNTNTISAICPSSAAYACKNLLQNGYNDWYMPSYNELQQLYNNRVAIGNFNSGVSYWCSTEYDATNAWYCYFGGGAFSLSSKNWSGSMGVRPIRTF
jgi:hypothetical protein